MADPMAALKTRFLQRLAEERSVLAGDGPDSAQAIHRLAGTAGVFGFGALSERARAVDERPADHAARAALAAEIERVLTHG